MARNTKRIYSVGQAADADAEAPDGAAAASDESLPPASVRPVIDVGGAQRPVESTPPSSPSRSPDDLATRRISLPRHEKPLPLTRARSVHAEPGPKGTIRLAPDEIADLEGREGERDDDAEPTLLRAGAGRRCAECGTQFSTPEIRFCPFDGQPMEDVLDWDPTSDPLVGRTVSDRFAVDAVLAEGSMGTIYRVTHERLGARFAMKVLRRDLAREEEVATRLIEEARTTAAIGHPNIVAVSDFGEIDSSVLPDLGALRLPYFVMELLEGRSLADEIRDAGPLPAQRIARITAQCAAALSAAHARDVVHRDLKPANIRLVRSELDDEMVKVVDFGVAKIMTMSRKTQPGVVFGTPHYMSPEQGKGLAVDGRTDVYSLGVIMYECMMGIVPFEADTYMGVVTQHLFTRPAPVTPPPDDPWGEVLAPIIMRCLAKAPADRYPTMSALSADLERVASGAKPTAGLEPSGRRMRLREPVQGPGTSPSQVVDLPGVPSGFPWRAAARVAAVAVAVGAAVLWVRHALVSERPAAAVGGETSSATVASALQRPPQSTTSVTTDSLATGAGGAAADAGAAAPTSSPQISAPRQLPATSIASGAASAPPAATADSAAPQPPPTTKPPPARPPARPVGEVIDPWAN